MDDNITPFPVSLTERLRRWDATRFDLGECVHDDCSNPALFYLSHRLNPTAGPTLTFFTGEHAQSMRRFWENHYKDLRSFPVVCAECAHGALAAVIADGTGR